MALAGQLTRAYISKYTLKIEKGKRKTPKFPFLATFCEIA
jgi:hypothetical protein